MVQIRVPILRHTNEVIEAYVTAGARILLYRCLDQLRENIMYCDNDVVLYVQPKGDVLHLIETGD